MLRISVSLTFILFATAIPITSPTCGHLVFEKPHTQGLMCAISFDLRYHPMQLILFLFYRWENVVDWRLDSGVYDSQSRALSILF